MRHPFEVLRPEYERLMSQMMITRPAVVDRTVHRLLDHYHAGHYGDVSDVTGIPLIYIMASFEREASSDFTRSPAQGDRWDRRSIHVPRNRGPFPDWRSSAIDAYHINHLDSVGTGNWSWALLCYYGELFNGFGYRDFHREHSPYLWGASNIQQVGKYTSDGRFDVNTMDVQLGIVPMMKRICEIAPELRQGLADWFFPSQGPSIAIPVIPQMSPVGLGGGGANTKFLQTNLNALGHEPPLDPDGNFGHLTELAVREFQAKRGIRVDGLAGPETMTEIAKALNERGIG